MEHSLGESCASVEECAFPASADTDGKPKSLEWVTQRRAVDEYCVSLQTLREAAKDGILEVKQLENPHGASFAPMRLYRQDEVLHLAVKIWGSEEGLVCERNRRREQRWRQRLQSAAAFSSTTNPLDQARESAVSSGIRALPDLREFLRSSYKRKQRLSSWSATAEYSTSGSSSNSTVTKPSSSSIVYTTTYIPKTTSSSETSTSFESNSSSGLSTPSANAFSNKSIELVSSLPSEDFKAVQSSVNRERGERQNHHRCSQGDAAAETPYRRTRNARSKKQMYEVRGKTRVKKNYINGQKETDAQGAVIEEVWEEI